MTAQSIDEFLADQERGATLPPLGRAKSIDEFVADNPMPETPSARQPRAQPPSGPQDGASFREFWAKNLPQSAMNEVRNLIYPITNTEEFVRNIPKLFSKEGLKALGGYFGERYGSPLQAMRTAYSEPAAFLGDMSLLVGGPIRGAGFAGKLMTKGGSNLRRVADKVSDVGRNIDALDPINVGIQATRTASSNILPGVATFPESTYDTNLKMGRGKRLKLQHVRDRVIKTLLENDISLDAKGVVKLDELIKTKSANLDALYEAADASGRRISIDEIMEQLRDFRREVDNPLTNPDRVSELSQIDNVVNTWQDDLWEIGNPQDMRPTEVRKLRQNLDRQNSFNLSDTTPAASKTAKEEIAHGARNAIRRNFEEMGGEAREISYLLEAQEPAIRATQRMSRNNNIPLRSAIGAAAGASAAVSSEQVVNQIIAAIGSGAALAWSPGNKEKLARFIYRSKDINRDTKRGLIQTLLFQAPRAAQAIEQGEQYNDQYE